MENLKGLGMILLGVAVVVGLWTLVGIFFVGLVKVSEAALFYVYWVAQIALLLSVLIFLPLALFRATRAIATYGLYVSSFVFGAGTWIVGLLVTWTYWGLPGVILGVCIAGFGIVPVGIVAAAFNSDWFSVVMGVVGLVLTFGARAVALWLGEKVDRYNYEKRMKIIDADRAA